MQFLKREIVGEEELRFLIDRVFRRPCLNELYAEYSVGIELGARGDEAARLGREVLERAVELGLLRKRTFNLYGSGLLRQYYCRTKKCEEAR